MTAITNNFISSVDRFDNEGSLVVWLSEEGQKALNCDSYEINSSCGCATIVWDDNTNGYQEVQHSPGGTEDARVLEYMLEKPESAIEDIQSRLAALKEEVVTDIRREFVDGTSALEDVKAEFFAQCGTEEDRTNLKTGEFRIVW